MLFYSYFKTLVGKEVTVELKNDLAITGVLHSVDQYLNIKLNHTRVVNEAKYPHMMSVKNCFIRGSVVRYIQQVRCQACSFLEPCGADGNIVPGKKLPAAAVDTEILHDATRREARS